VNGSLSNNLLGYFEISAIMLAALLGLPDGLDVSRRHSAKPDKFADTYAKPQDDLRVVFTRPASQSALTA
jgi:hypothetical protein